MFNFVFVGKHNLPAKLILSGNPKSLNNVGLPKLVWASTDPVPIKFAVNGVPPIVPVMEILKLQTEKAIPFSTILVIA